MSDSKSSDTIMAFLLGAVAGAVAGVLLAPAAGKETRKKLKVISDDLKEGFDDFVSEAKERFSSEKEKIESALEAGKKAYDKK